MALPSLGHPGTPSNAGESQKTGFNLGPKVNAPVAAAVKGQWGNDHANLNNTGADDNVNTKANRLSAMKRRMSSNHSF